MLLSMTINDEHTISMVGTSMEAKTSTLIQSKSIVIPIATTLNPSSTLEDVWLYVKVDVTKVTIMEE